MRNTLHTVITAVTLLIPATGGAQQTPSPQPPQAKSVPCGIPSTPPKASSRFHFKIPPRAQAAINKQETRIEVETGIKVDTNKIIQDAMAAKPCEASPVPAPAPTRPQGNTAQ